MQKNYPTKYSKIFFTVFTISILNLNIAFSQTQGPATTFTVNSSTTSIGGTASGSVSGSSGGSGTFTITNTAGNGSNGVVWTGYGNGIQTQVVEDGSIGTQSNPNTLGYNFSVTAISGSVLNTTLTRAETGQSGNSEPETIYITWSGGGNATLSDPNTQFVSAPSSFASGTTLTFLGASHASLLNTGNTWLITIPAKAFSISVTALKNYTGQWDFSNEWFVFDAKMSGTILPMTGVNLNATSTNQSIHLNWQTLTEINSEDFEIQKSVDGINFSTIATIAASGNSNIPINYSYDDANASNNPKLFYRLKENDLDGNFAYSNVAEIHQNLSNGIKVFPTVFSNNSSIEFTNRKGNYNLSFINAIGQVLHEQQIEVTSDMQYININKPSSLIAGIYFVVLKNENTGELFSQRVLVK